MNPLRLQGDAAGIVTSLALGQLLTVFHPWCYRLLFELVESLNVFELILILVHKYKSQVHGFFSYFFLNQGAMAQSTFWFLLYQNLLI